MTTGSTDMPPEAIEQTVPWIVQHQRAHCSGTSPLTTFQGVLCDEIFLPQSAADHDDPAQLAMANDAWVDALSNQAHFLPGEFSQEALWSYHARAYLTQVQAGGHAQYFSNHGSDEIALKCVSAGLKSMLADPHFEVFSLFVRLKRAAPKAARKIAAERGYRSVEAALKDLDAKFAEVEAKEPLAPRQKTWLKSLRKLKLVPDAEMTGHLQRVAQGNPLFARRKLEADRARAETLQRSPAFRTTKALCDTAGLAITNFRVLGFGPMRSVWPDGPETQAFICHVETDKGVRAAAFYSGGGFRKRFLGVLGAEGGGPPTASLSLNRAEYDQIVPKT